MMLIWRESEMESGKKVCVPRGETNGTTTVAPPSTPPIYEVKNFYKNTLY